jgi:hypothetical protein
MRYKIKKNDIVRFIYKDYFSAFKDDYSQPVKWSNPNTNTEYLSIGAEYIVKDVRRINVFWEYYQFYNNKEWISKAHIIPANKFEACPFRIGDSVLYKPICSKKEIKLLSIANPYLIIDNIYKVLMIINDYYVIINTKFPENWKNNMDKKSLPEASLKLMHQYKNMLYKINDIKDESTPLRWIDLHKI